MRKLILGNTSTEHDVGIYNTEEEAFEAWEDFFYDHWMEMPEERLNEIEREYNGDEERFFINHKNGVIGWYEIEWFDDEDPMYADLVEKFK